MSLKDLIAKDIGRVFLNPAEFAERHTINGISVLAIVDSDVIEGGGSTAQGVYMGLKRVFVSTEAFPARFAHGARIELDGKPYFVRDCSEEMGMYVITIEANKT